MPLRPLARRLGPTKASPFFCRCSSIHSSAIQRKRPALPFLSAPTTAPTTSPSTGRRFTSAQKQWFKHEMKLAFRYTTTFCGCVLAALGINYAINQEAIEREFPTPPEWSFLTRKRLRDAHHEDRPRLAKAYLSARAAIARLEKSESSSQNLVKLADPPDPKVEYPEEFIPYDISANSEDWRRGYFEALMFSAKAGQVLEGHLLDVTRDFIFPPEYVIGPSNPRPKPIPPGAPSAPLERNCRLAYPPFEHHYIKMLATEGFSPRQRVDAALEFAAAVQSKGKLDAAEALYTLALKEATRNIEPAHLPYDTKTLILKDGGEPPSANILEALTAMANFKARTGQLSSALPMYVSLLKARRCLSDTPPPPAISNSPPPSTMQRMLDYFKPPPYPKSPGDGTEPPWRNSLGRCQEAALHLYIGEILYATSSRVDGLAWTRDAVDLSEEQLRAGEVDKETKQRCRECLATGLNNWSAMVAQLAQAEKAKKKTGVKRIIPFWQKAEETESRWGSEQAVVVDRVKRTRELLVDPTPIPSRDLISFFTA
ncbi:hypothetical protein L249_0786 [Ophiocordyceps polyrhachis-furcata BCC 54312]|uniref:MFS maltose permease n=1 Tax=Ophiocordyceps polyrhachis-furcata BCC 54312 TaxID=1330021 RepID=A0A367LEJ4_9HYPO|nr:hypothetical protein L249_0786 [Ophiocordyceps polyrhachis-furcata BCC 54312]